MAVNSRFSFAIHIMTILAYRGHEGATSSILAESISTNPVVVRRLLSQLRQGGLIRCQSGKSGGCQLARDPEKISLYDIYAAVEAGGPFVIPQKPQNKACVVSCHMKEILENIFEQTQQAIAKSLQHTTLASLLRTVQEVAA